MKPGRPALFVMLASAPVSVLGAWLLAGGGGATLVILAWLLALVARFDNRSGAFLVLAVLVLLVLFTLLLLIALMALQR